MSKDRSPRDRRRKSEVADDVESRYHNAMVCRSTRCQASGNHMEAHGGAEKACQADKTGIELCVFRGTFGLGKEQRHDLKPAVLSSERRCGSKATGRMRMWATGFARRKKVAVDVSHTHHTMV